MVINACPSNKTPRPEGFTGEFYKMFQTQLIADMLHVFNTALQNLIVRLSPLNDAYIVLIPKKKKTCNGHIKLQIDKPNKCGAENLP
jgi:hypothetical protein